MPRKYKRKVGVQPRVITWNEDTLAAAIAEMQDKRLGINDIARRHGIPSRTLRRRFATQNKKITTLGKHPTLGFENERRLVAHIQKLKRSGFAPDQKTVRVLAYGFAEKLKIKHNFSTEKKLAGNEWLQSFLERNPILKIRQAEGLSDSDGLALLNRKEVNGFYDLLAKVLEENDLLDKPDRIFNMDETGVSITPSEKGVTLTIVACCNAVGNFLPPVVIVHIKDEFIDDLPPFSKAFMNEKSADINAELFLKWLREHFIPIKPQGKVLLILDGHSSHFSAVDLLEIARNNDIILLCLPSQTSSAVQPLDRAVFKPFKTFFTAEINYHMRINPQKRIDCQQSGKLIERAWIRATTPANAIAGFRDTGIYPLNYNSIPENEFLTENIDDYNLGLESDCNLELESQPGTSQQTSQTDLIEPVEMAARLDERRIKILMEEVKKRPYLWDPADDCYSDRLRSTLAWRQISNLLDIPDDVARMKWKNLRDLFKRVINKYELTNPDDYLGKWRHFKSLWFLYEPCTRYTNKVECSMDSVYDNALYECSSSPEPLDSVEEDNIKCEPMEDNSQGTLYFERPIEYENPIEPIESQDPIKPIESENPIKPIKYEDPNEEDSDMLFLKSLCPYFKQLQPIRKLLVRSKIQELLYNEILQQSSSGSGRDKS